MANKEQQIKNSFIYMLTVIIGSVLPFITLPILPGFLYTLDPILGPKLLEIYNKMDSYPRITIYSDQVNTSELISVSDMVVSFPFTSTTFEALTMNKPAIWHDPMGYYRDNAYREIAGITTHSYDEPKTRLFEIKNMKPEIYKNPVPITSSLMNPYRDGKAIERFRDLLTID